MTRGGRVFADSDGVTLWKTDRNSRHACVGLKADAREFERIIGDLMRSPRRANSEKARTPAVDP